MNDQVFQQLLELSWRRNLTPEEESRLQTLLAEDAEARARWDAEAALNRVLEDLPPGPEVSSNFTSRVLEAVKRDTTARRPFPRIRRAWPAWLPRIAIGLAALALCFGGYQHHLKVVKNRMAIASSVAEVSDLYQVVAARPDALEDFEAIRCLETFQPKADNELLTLLQ